MSHHTVIQRETAGRDDDEDEEERREEAAAAASWQRYLDATRERDAFAEGCVCAIWLFKFFMRKLLSDSAVAAQKIVFARDLHS